MAHLREEVPAEFTDDERWWKYFTTRSLIVLGVAVVLTLILSKLFSLINLTVVGFVLGALVGVAAFFVTVFKWPINDTMNGAGCTLATMLFRGVCLKKKSRIYVKKYSPREDCDK